MSNIYHKQNVAIPFLVEGKSKAETAKRVGVTRQTISNWFKDPSFATELKRQQHERINTLTQKYNELEDLAVKTIKAILQDTSAKPSDKLRAAELIQRGSFQFTQFQNMQTRLEEIEDWIVNWENTP